MGAIGLSLDDFSRLYVDEFEAVCQSWHDSREQAERNAWERMRISAAVSIQPYVRKRITPKELIPLPWDKENTAKPLSKEEDKKRMEELIKRLGGT